MTTRLSRNEKKTLLTSPLVRAKVVWLRDISEDMAVAVKSRSTTAYFDFSGRPIACRGDFFDGYLKKNGEYPHLVINYCEDALLYAFNEGRAR